MLCWSFRENRRPIESTIKRSVWVGFSIFSIHNWIKSGNKHALNHSRNGGGREETEGKETAAACPPPPKRSATTKCFEFSSRDRLPPPRPLSTGTGWPHVEETLQDSSVSPSSLEFFEIVKVEQPDKIQILTSLRLILC